MKKLPLGIQSFKEIIEGDYVYVDKTQYIYNLIHSAKYYFLSRPRRFGKSLLLDTISEVFSGGKELFKGLWIYDSDYCFDIHPVIKLDMSNISNKTPETLETAIMLELQGRIQDEAFGVASGVPSYMLKRLIELLYAKYNQRVVVLVDEYDKPILDHTTDTHRGRRRPSARRCSQGKQPQIMNWCMTPRSRPSALQRPSAFLALRCCIYTLCLGCVRSLFWCIMHIKRS